jgi:hypothetical protein
LAEDLNFQADTRQPITSICLITEFQILVKNSSFHFVFISFLWLTLGGADADGDEV